MTPIHCRQRPGIFDLTLVIFALSTAAGAAYAADTPAQDSKRCIPIKDIRRTEVIDDQNILFHLRNKKTYNNHLPHRCGGLAYAKAFKYETAQSELCNVDIISVINTTTGTLMPGASCALGLFERVEAKSTDTKPSHSSAGDSDIDGSQKSATD